VTRSSSGQKIIVLNLFSGHFQNQLSSLSSNEQMQLFFIEDEVIKLAKLLVQRIQSLSKVKYPNLYQMLKKGELNAKSSMIIQRK